MVCVYHWHIKIWSQYEFFKTKTGTHAMKMNMRKQFPYQNTNSYYVKMKFYLNK